MLNRNLFIEDCFTLFASKIFDSKPLFAQTARYSNIPLKEHMLSTISVVALSAFRPSVAYQSKSSSALVCYSPTEYLFDLLHFFSPEDEGGFTKEEIEKLLSDHAGIVCLFMTPTYQGFLDYFENFSFDTTNVQRKEKTDRINATCATSNPLVPVIMDAATQIQTLQNELTALRQELATSNNKNYSLTEQLQGRSVQEPRFFQALRAPKMTTLTPNVEVTSEAASTRLSN